MCVAVMEFCMPNPKTATEAGPPCLNDACAFYLGLGFRECTTDPSFDGIPRIPDR